MYLKSTKPFNLYSTFSFGGKRFHGDTAKPREIPQLW